MANAEAPRIYGSPLGQALVGRRFSLRAGRRAPVSLLAAGTLGPFAAAELVTTFVDPIAGMALHAIVLSALILAAGLTAEEGPGAASAPVSRLLYALTLVPLIRIISLSMPLARFDAALWYLMAGLPVFVAGVVIMGVIGLRPVAVGLRLSRSPLQPAVMLLGFGLGFVEYQILRPEPLIAQATLTRFILPALILLVATGFLEEFLFRGILQAVASGPFGGLSVVYVAIVFAILHIGYRSATDFVFVLIIALVYGWVVRRTGSIAGVSVSHGITNIVLFLVVPFLPFLSVRPDWLVLP